MNTRPGEPGESRLSREPVNIQPALVSKNPVSKQFKLSTKPVKIESSFSEKLATYVSL